ncbi:glycoside hydrolase [Lindgomyces ingoldianus]|uniref:Glycoside hydrolase n=1 Tax=Lindgomyces ingoldianus TaxID=673940 RepID=A0ACB6QKZ1_9PLEO|nr:glycoside hydrolase [Lindgomyces ingoldianus]KAF2466806.1 glycoside hydrolase [Lindgomyces ingoldianus]
METTATELPSFVIPYTSSKTPVITSAPLTSSSISVVSSMDSISSVISSIPPVLVSAAPAESSSLDTSSMAPSSIAEPSYAPPLPDTSSTATTKSYTTSSPQASSNTWFPIGVAWDAFSMINGQPQCKTESQVASEFEIIKEYEVVRTYGIGCSQVDLVVQHAVANGQKLMLGFYLPDETPSDAVEAFSSAIEEYAKSNWDVVIAVTVENERASDHQLTTSAIVDAINQTREGLRAVHYDGPVGAVETAAFTISDPTICDNSDLAFVNIHPFFDENTEAPNSGQFVKDQVALVEKVCPSKRVIVMESGWPYQGQAHGKAIPSRDNQKVAIESLRSSFSQDLILLSPFDSTWKMETAETFYAERHWGFLST